MEIKYLLSSLDFNEYSLALRAKRCSQSCFLSLAVVSFCHQESRGGSGEHKIRVLIFFFSRSPSFDGKIPITTRILFHLVFRFLYEINA